MKKCCLILITLICLLCFCFATAEEANVFYENDLCQNAENWYSRGENALLTVTEEGLLITERQAKADTPAIALSLKAGMTYTFSVQVMQTEREKAEFSISIEHQRGNKTYTRLGGTTASRGEWVTVTGEWKAENYDSYVFFVSTVGNQELNFTIRNVHIEAEDRSKLTPVTWEGELPSLRDTFADLFDFGTCISTWDVYNTQRTALVLKQYSIITPENELKPDSVLDVAASRKLAQTDDTLVAVNFSNAKPILDFAKKNGLKVHGHVLVWHSQTPEAFFHEGYDTTKPYVTREVMLARLENYIRQVFEYMDQNYPGLIVSWDVANECVADGSSSLRESNWTRVVGNDFVLRAFEYADKYAPQDVLLCYNDYSTPYEPKLSGIVKLLTDLVAEGHIDGYGFQSHYASNDPSIEAVRTAFEKISALGLKLRVSELDITVTEDTDVTRAQQATQYESLMKLYIEYADKLEAVQVWGVCDGTSWIREKMPLIFDASLQPKPAFFSVINTMTE